MLYAVHGQRGSEHQHQYDKHRGKDLIALLLDNGGDDLEGVILCVDAEQVEDAHHTEHPEDDETVQEVKRQDGQQIDYAVIGEEEPDACGKACPVGIEVIRRPDAQDIFRGEHADRADFDAVQHGIEGRQLIKGQQNHSKDIQNDDRDDKPVKCETRQIAGVADLDDIKDALAHIPLCHCCSSPDPHLVFK